jgi:PAS domain-containing protein
VRGRQLGTIAYLVHGQERARTPAQAAVLEDIARRAALALDTARWAAEAQRARSATEAHARELEATIEAMADGVVVYDQEARIVRVNGAAHALFAFDAGEDLTRLPLVERARRNRIRNAAGRLL